MKEVDFMREGYKNTELGEIPEEWEVEELDSIVEINPENLNSQSDENMYINYIDIESVSTGKIRGVKKLQIKEAPSRAKRIVKQDDILVSTVRPYLKAFTIVKSNQENQVCSTGFAVLRANDNIDYKYIYQNTLSEVFINQLNNKMVGSNYPAVNTTDIKSTYFPVPPLKEQKKIATILSSVDEHIEEVDFMIEDLKELKKGLMQKLLTGQYTLEDGKLVKTKEFKKTSLGMLPVSWEVENLNNISEIVMGQSPLSESYNDIGNGIPLIQGNADCKNRKTVPRMFTTHVTKRCEINDIIMTVRAPVGAISKSLHNACIGRGVCAIKIKDHFNEEFIYQYLISYENKWDSLSQGSTFTAVNSKDIKSIIVPVPSTQEQTKIASILSSVDNRIETYKNEKQDLQDLKKGLMQQLLTGKKRVKTD